MLQFYYVSLNRPTYVVDGYIESCKRLLHNLYNYYVSIYNSGTSSNNAPFEGVQTYDPFISNILNSQNRFATSSSSTRQSMEIDDYLCHQFEFQEDHEILKWWRQKSGKFPILAKIAKDILAIPASTIASESAFSAGIRVLDEKRSRLAPDTIQMCVCKKDWDQAEQRTQGLRNDDDQEDDDPLMLMDTDTSIGSPLEEDESDSD